MAKITLNDIPSGFFSNTAHNTNNGLIETALENTLSRDGTSPNQMEANLDMNSFRVVNLPEPINSNEAARLQDVQNGIAGASIANLVSFTPYSNIASNTVQGAIQEEVNDLAASSGSSLVGFIQAGTGAVPRTVQSKDRERISVLDFGDNTTPGTTDMAAIAQLAVDAAGNNTVIEFPGAGPYKIGAAGVLVSAKHGITFEGNAVIKFSAQTALTIQSMGRAGIKFVSCTKSGVRGLTFDGNSIVQAAVGFDANTDCFVDNCEVYSCGGIAQIVSAGGTNTQITFNKIHTAVGTAKGMWLGNLTAAEIETSLHVYGNYVTGSGGTGIVFTSVGGRCFGNYSSNNAGSGIIFSGANGYSAKRISCMGNTCNANAYHGVQSDVVYTTDADLTSDMVIVGNTCDGNTGSGIYALNVKSWQINANTVTNNANGITSGDRAYNIGISANTIRDTRSAGARTQGVGIQFTCQANNSSNILMSGNVIDNNVSSNIQVNVNTGYTLTGLNINGNSVSGAAYGVFITETDVGSVIDGLVTGNVALGAGTADIRVTASDVLVANNNYNTQNAAVSNTFVDADTTPAISGKNSYLASNTGATTITAFDGTSPYLKDITIWATNGNTTLQHGTIILKGAANTTIPGNGIITFRHLGSNNWLEVSRSY